jgi:hypothetical protein
MMKARARDAHDSHRAARNREYTRRASAATDACLRDTNHNEGNSIHNESNESENDIPETSGAAPTKKFVKKRDEWRRKKRDEWRRAARKVAESAIWLTAALPALAVRP